MYFKKFPLVTYSLDQGQTAFYMTDFFARMQAKTENILTATAYDQYDIMDGDTPETLADKIYGDMMLYWVILVANNLFDPRWDWPLNEDTLRRYIVDKYGANNQGAVHHYVNADGDIVHSSYASAKTAVSNTTYELELNEAKRKISIIKPEFVPQFVNNFNGILLNNG